MRSVIAVPGVAAQRFQRGDDLVEVDQDLAVVSGQPFPPGGLGGTEQLAGLPGVLAVDREEFGGGLEVRAGQAGVGVRAVLLRRAAAMAVGEGVSGPGQPVLDPFGVRGGRGSKPSSLPSMSTRVWQ